MFKKLKAHWKVDDINLFMIIATFALGGSLCGYAGRKILLLTDLEKGPVWFMLYLILIFLLWPVCVLLISIPLGQFAFFKRYINRIWMKISGNKKDKINHREVISIAIFASGAGSNAEKIIASSKNNQVFRVELIVCNKAGAGVLQIADQAGIPTLIIKKERFITGDNYLPELKKHQIDFIVLAGFLWKLPVQLIQAYPKKIINIHPALLPKYGGKGMFGSKVHESVIANKEKESGITIHYVDELYDHGEIILQSKCLVDDDDTPDTLAQKIHALEHTHYPAVINDLIKKQNRS